MNSNVLTIGVGYDKVESTAWHTLIHSIMAKSTRPLAFIPIKRKNLISIYTRPRDPKQSNDFSFTRFLLPYLCGYQGQSLFMDCDMLVRTDITELFDLFDKQYAVQVVKHDYSPSDQVKYLGTVQYTYPKKNWSSVMLFNNEQCTALTPEYVNTASGLELHQFKWLESAGLVGELPLAWNWLVGEYPFGYGGVEKDNVKNAHFTIGGPYFLEYAKQDIDFSVDWFHAHAMMDFCRQRYELIEDEE
jgi:hypothetical protein